MTYVEKNRQKIEEFVAECLTAGAVSADSKMTTDEVLTMIEPLVEALADKLEEMVIMAEIRVPSLSEANEIHARQFSYGR